MVKKIITLPIDCINQDKISHLNKCQDNLWIKTNVGTIVILSLGLKFSIPFVVFILSRPNFNKLLEIDMVEIYFITQVQIKHIYNQKCQ